MSESTRARCSQDNLPFPSMLDAQQHEHAVQATARWKDARTALRHMIDKEG